MTKLIELRKIGQSIWYDNIRRGLLDDGGLQALIDAGVAGVTSNPSIFEKAIAHSTDYDKALVDLVEEGKSTQQIYESLVIEDIQRTADLLYPVYEDTNGLDGYVSLEVDPTLAQDTAATIAEARRLFATLGRPNAMIKVPATPAGVPAIATLIGDGININVTLLFANDNYSDVAQAYIDGLEQFAARGGDLSRVASVASFFVSRVDSAVDKALEAIGNSDLQGEIAIANAKIAYTIFETIFSTPRWQTLVGQGARPQRLLWASTSTKNPAFSDVLYMDGLIGPDTVNTVPPATLDAFQDHGTVEVSLTLDVEKARRQVAKLAELKIDLDEITAQLQVEGVKSFANAFVSLMNSINERRQKILADRFKLTTALGEYGPAVESTEDKLRQDNIINRVWAIDHTVWRSDPTEITNRLGWLAMPEVMMGNIKAIEDLVADVRSQGYTQAVLLGMGGSSLAPEVFRKTFGVRKGFLDLIVLDSTDPGAVLAVEQRLIFAQTLFIVATKSGGTAETFSFFKYFYNRLSSELGAERAGEHFVAITDPGSKLEATASQYHFRAVFLNDPNIGGRYSALSYFGLVAAGLIGVDLSLILDRAQIAACNAGGEFCADHQPNAAAQLGSIMAILAQEGRDKLTLITSPELASFGDWVEQLIAESTGKEGKGILPVVGEIVGPPEVYGPDRLFVYLRLVGSGAADDQVRAFQKAGQPIAGLTLKDRYDLGGQFFLWEFATAVAGSLIDIQPFDQPNVEAAKIQARKMIAAYQESGSLPEGETAQASAANLAAFVEQANPGDYIAIQAYVQPTLETEDALKELREYLRNNTKLAVTMGYGPRFLHSTGQLHKGDAGNGLFVQITAEMPLDLPIPDEAGQETSGITFGILKTAQALGDAAALRGENRRLIHFHLGSDVPAGIRNLW